MADSTPIQKGEAKLIQLSEAGLTDEQLNGIRAFAKDCGNPTEPTNLLKGRHGITHYTFDEPKDINIAERKIIVLCHGLGTNMHVWSQGEFVQPLVDKGFSVLRLDYLGFNWSIPNNQLAEYTTTMLAEQIEDLLDHICTGPEESIYCMFGHSLGGVASVLTANDQGSTARKVERLCLICPAFWVEKPLIVRMSDRIPTFMYWLAKKGALDGEVKKTIVANNGNAFGKDESGEFIYKETKLRMDKNISSMFANHPFACKTIISIGTFMLTNQLLEGYQEIMYRLANRETNPVPVALVWGKLDIVVPYRYAEAAAAKSENVVLYAPEKMAHDCLYENPAEIFSHCEKFLEANK